MESMRDVLESFRSRPARPLKQKRAKPRKFKPSGGPWLDRRRLRIAQPPPPRSQRGRSAAMAPGIVTGRRRRAMLRMGRDLAGVRNHIVA